MTQTHHIPWSKPDIGSEEKCAVNRVLDSGWLSQGKETEAFEHELERFIGCRHVIAVNNGTSALICALLAHRARSVTVPAYSFPATWNAPRLLNISTRFRDINPRTFLIKSNRLSDCLPVSIAGLPFNEEEWFEQTILEDACEALGAETRGKKVGNQGWTACFSFHIAKLLSTVEGGCIATNDMEVAEKCRLIRSHGENPERKYDFKSFGLNFRTTDLNSAIGRVQLKKLPSYLANRARVARFYREELKSLVEFQVIPDYVRTHANMMFPILLPDPSLIALKLSELGIETRRPFPPAVSLLNADAVYSRVLALPIFNTMTLDEAMIVVDAVKRSLV